jgi:hypothetical protein
MRSSRSWSSAAWSRCATRERARSAICAIRASGRGRACALHASPARIAEHRLDFAIGTSAADRAGEAESGDHNRDPRRIEAALAKGNEGEDTMTIIRSGHFTLPILFTMFAGCMTADDAAAPERLAPITSLALANGNTVEFYETSPGMLLVSETGRVGIPPVPTSALRPLDLYRQLAPGQPAPEVLVAAQARADARFKDSAPPAGDTEPAPMPQVASAVPGYIDNQSCDDHWFDDTFCTGSPDWQMCLLNHWDGAYAQLGSVDWVKHATCADIGNITLQIQMGDGTGGIWDVLEGHYRWFSWKDECVFGCNESTRGDILNATDNRFHYSVKANF